MGFLQTRLQRSHETTVVHGAVVMALRQQAFVTAVRQYLLVLAGAAAGEGVELDTADTPLVR